MALLLPCKNEISAHVLRSRLLSHGLECAIVHGNAATLWGGWVMRPRLMIAAEDLEAARAFLGEPEGALDDTFIEPAETVELNENPGLSSTIPNFVVMATVGFALGAVELAVVTVFTMVTGGAAREVVEQNPALLLPLYGAVSGIVVWPFVWFARSCRLDANGELPLHARFVFLVMLLQNDVFWVLVYVGQILGEKILSILPEPLRKWIPDSLWRL